MSKKIIRDDRLIFLDPDGTVAGFAGVLEFEEFEELEEEPDTNDENMVKIFQEEIRRQFVS